MKTKSGLVSIGNGSLSARTPGAGRFSYLLITAVLLVGFRTVPAQAAESPRYNEQDLIAVLQSDSPPAEKAITCKRLAVFGSEAAVPALAPLLTDPHLNSWARIALEAIPGPAADMALRQAIDKTQGLLLVGVLNSIGVRRDAQAVPALAARLDDPDSQVASAAAVALGRIGNLETAKILNEALAKAPAATRASVAEGCIRCAEHLFADGKSGDAVKLYDTVRKSQAPKQKVLEATRGAILARKSGGVSLLVEQLRSADKGFFQIGLTTARELPGGKATKAVEAELRRAAPDRQPAMLLA
ncbi:MAG: HEAT repeat domain-containing protein, partial [Limisphaerales bacterium]